MVEKSVLDSGLVVITETIAAFPSFALSYTVRGGSRMETADNNGIYHLLEHMMFKGTKKYDLKEIADISDRLGGKLNAFTSKEITQYYVKAIDENLEPAFELLTEMVSRSVFPVEEFNKEKGVAVEEIHESEDNPDTHAFETFYRDVFKGHGLGLPVGGQVEPVSSFERDGVFEFYHRYYGPDNMVLAAVGNVKHGQLVGLAEQAFKHFPSASAKDFQVEKPVFHPVNFSKSNPSLNQVYVIMGFNGLPVVSPKRYNYMILNDIMGAGMSSRLFQKIREEKGLAYTVSSFSDAYMDCGLHLIYSIVKPGNVRECVDAVRTELSLLKKQGISNDELERARSSIKSSIILGLENNVSKMRFNINGELFLHREVSTREVLDRINGVTMDDIQEILDTYLNLDKMSIFLYGDVPTQ
jgi:predicted Zn-dependent peptidase